MKIAIIGAGFSGLAAAWDLVEAGYEVEVYEADSKPGGLAAGFKGNGWDWFLEHHYHHIFATDQAFKRLLTEMDLEDLLFYADVFTGSYYQDEIDPLDSPTALIKYPFLSWPAKLRTAATLAFLKIFPQGKLLEKWTAENFLKSTMGQEAWQVLWKPLFVNKFGSFADEINAAWFWARIHARSKKLGYFKGGFQTLADKMGELLKSKGVKFYFETKVAKIEQIESDQTLRVITNSSREQYFQVVFTATSQILDRLVDFPKPFQARLDKLDSLGAMTLVLELDKPFFEDQVYWLNINELDWPFLAVVEQTNLVSPDKYNQSHLVYVGNYLDQASPKFDLDKEKLLATYQPYLERLNPNFSNNLKQVFLFKSRFAQPVVKKNHSRILPTIETPVQGLYWAGMEQIYPFDRGTNYAIEIGRKAADKIIDNHV
jgi:protoporphyrinogen oxidase